MLIAAGLLLTLGALAWSAQGLLLYPAPVATPPTAADVAPAQLVALPPSYALYLPAPGAAADRPAPLMIFAHGNAEAAVQWLPEVEALHEAGLSLLLLEYPGYAGAEGRPDRRSLRAVALAAHDWARAQPAVDDRERRPVVGARRAVVLEPQQRRGEHGEAHAAVADVYFACRVGERIVRRRVGEGAILRRGRWRWYRRRRCKFAARVMRRRRWWRR